MQFQLKVLAMVILLPTREKSNFLRLAEDGGTAPEVLHRDPVLPKEPVPNPEELLKGLKGLCFRARVFVLEPVHCDLFLFAEHSAQLLRDSGVVLPVLVLELTHVFVKLLSLLPFHRVSEHVRGSRARGR